MSNAVKTPSLPSVHRALEALDHIAGSLNGLTLMQLTRTLGVPRSTMHCLLLTLERNGYVQRASGRGAYLCGSKLLELSGKTLAGVSLRAIAMPTLRALMQRTRLVIHMAVLDQEQVRIIAQIAPPEAELTTYIGQHLELHCTALGKAIAAWLPEAQVNATLGKRVLLPHNENTIVAHRRIREDLAVTRQRGYAIDDEEHAIGYRCLGAAVLDPSQTPLAAISLMGTTAEISHENCPRLAAELKRAADHVSAAIQDGRRLGEDPLPIAMASD